MKKKKILLSVIVPIYKSEASISELYRRLERALNSITKNHEIVLVEDCGGDRSWSIIEELAKADPRVRGIQFSRNFGQHYGITAGLDASRGDWVVVMDGDLQDQPEEIPRLWKKAKEGYDVVLALRGQRKHWWVKRAVSWVFYRIFSWLADIPYDGNVGNFRLMSRKVVDGYRSMREQLRFFSVQVQWLGFPTARIQVEHAERHSGRSTYTFGKLWKLGLETILAYSDKPLRLAVRLGFTMTAFSFLAAAYLVSRWVFAGVTVEGWTSLIVSFYLLSGMILFFMGILGVYLGKTFDQTKHRPLYIIRGTTFVDGD